MDSENTKMKIFLIVNVFIRAMRAGILPFINVCLLILNDYTEIIKQF